MEVILLENIETLGSRGQVVKVANGYGRNYLLPQKMAIAATPQNRKWVEQQRVRFLKLEAKERGDAEDLAKLMEGIGIVATRRSGEKGQLFGSVTAMDIEEELAAQGYKINRRKIQLGSPLKTVGEFEVPVKLHRDVTVNVKVRVESEGEPEAEPESKTKAAAKGETSGTTSAAVEEGKIEAAAEAAAEAGAETESEASADEASEDDDSESK